MSEHDKNINESKPVEEQNLERLLTTSYRPETPSASVVADVTERMLEEAAAARSAAGTVSMRMGAHMRTSGSNWRIWIPSAIAATLMIVLGVRAAVVAMRKDDAVRREVA